MEAHPVDTVAEATAIEAKRLVGIHPQQVVSDPVITKYDLLGMNRTLLTGPPSYGAGTTPGGFTQPRGPPGPPPGSDPQCVT